MFNKLRTLEYLNCCLNH